MQAPFSERTSIRLVACAAVSCLAAHASRAGVIVQWVGPDQIPTTPAYPQAGIDYEVTSDEPVGVILKTTAVENPNLPGDLWPVQRYFVGRVDDYGDPASLGLVTAQWNVLGVPQNIVVEVGTSETAPVDSVASIVIPSEDTANPPAVWSSIKLFVRGNLSPGPVQPAKDANGNGGRLAGSVLGQDASGLNIRAIGENGTQVGNLSLGQVLLGENVIEVFESGATLSADRLYGRLTINSSCNGTINLRSIVSVGAFFPGELLVLGAGVSSGTINLTGTDYPIEPGLVNGLIAIDHPNGEFSGTILLARLVSAASNIGTVRLRKLSGVLQVDREDVPMDGMIEVLGHVAVSGQILVDGGMKSATASHDSILRVHGDLGSDERRATKIAIGGVGLADHTARIEIIGTAWALLTLGGGTAPVPLNGSITFGQPGVNTTHVATVFHSGPIGRDPAGTSAGSFTIHGNMGGVYEQQGPAGESNEGTFAVTGDMTSSLTFVAGLYGSAGFPATVSVGKNMTGSIVLKGGMYDGKVLLNTTSGDTGTSQGGGGGTVQLGEEGFLWTDVLNVVDLGVIHVYGNWRRSAAVVVNGCFDTVPGSYTLRYLCVDGLSEGHVTYNVCPGATATLTRDCP